MFSAKEFAARANQLVGLPYVLGAEWPASVVAPAIPKAVDCSEVVEGLFRENGTPICDLAASQYDKTVAVKAGDERVGDLVFLRNNRARWNGIGHVAVITAKLSNGDWRIIEARGRAYGVVKTTLSYWKTRQYFTGVRRFPAFKLRVASTPTELKAKAIARQRAGNQTGRDKAVAKLRSARVRGLWAGFFAFWDKQNKSLSYTLLPPKAPENHAFVVLGAGLHKNGTITEEFSRRLEVALACWTANPDTPILVSGGAPKNGKTEAGVGSAWLQARGVPADKVWIENGSGSTVGNAKYSVPILVDKGITSYSIVSDASHLRRASVLFEAARVARDLTNKTKTQLVQANLVAYHDKEVSNPVGASELSVTALHSAILLGVYTAYTKLIS